VPEELGESVIAPLMQAMVADGVDTSDAAAVRLWLAAEGFAVDDDEGEEFEDVEDFSFQEAFGLPERLPPLRLPTDEELAAAARQSPLLAKARELAEWVGDGRALNADGELDATHCVALATALGIGLSDEVEVERIADVPELVHLWEVADSVDLIDVDGETAKAGTAMSEWPDGTDEDVLDIWATALAVIVTSLDLDADLYGDESVDFHGAGGAVLISLFLARNEGLDSGELAEMVDDAVVVTEAWTSAHGQPADALLTRLAALGATAHDGEIVRLAPLAQWAVWSQLQDSDVEIDVLPPIEEMAAADLVAAADGFTEDELFAEVSAWLALRTPDDAAKELLDVAATGDPGDRIYAVSVVNGLGAAATEHWRAVLADERLRAYARLALDEELEPTDTAWLLTDALAVTTEDETPEEIAQLLRDAVPAGTEADVFEVMWRLPHPLVGEVLTMVGATHPDKDIAKAARKAAFKVGSNAG
jgi:hypothetical protein